MLVSLCSLAQTGGIKGHVMNEAGNPLESIHISIKGTTRGAMTSNSGEFFLSGLAAGKYHLVVSGVGYQTIERSASVTDNATLTLELTLRETAQQLQTVEIIGRRETTYKNDQSFIASKTATP
jgi:iron complex outermembrane receptor protein